MCKASAIGNVAGLGGSERDGTRMMGDADGPEGAKGKADIITPDKTNKTPILVSY